MPKIIIETTEETKKRFTVKCAREGKTQKDVVNNLINKWVSRGNK